MAKAEMIDCNFTLKRPATGTVLRYKETMPKNYIPFYFEILHKSYPGWTISYTTKIEMW